jgi:hypothetical protein
MGHALLCCNGYVCIVQPAKHSIFFNINLIIPKLKFGHQSRSTEGFEIPCSQIININFIKYKLCKSI